MPVFVSKFPYPLYTMVVKQSSVKGFSSFFVIVPLFLTIMYLLNIRNLFPYITLFDFQAGIITIAIYILSTLMNNSNSNSSIMSALVDIRRDAFLGNSSNLAIKKQLEIAMLGLQTSDLEQIYLINVLSLLKKADIELAEVNKKITILANSYKEGKKKLPDSSKEIIDAINFTIFERLKKYDNIINGDDLTVTIMYMDFVRKRLPFSLGNKEALESALEKIAEETERSKSQYVYLLEIWVNLFNRDEKEKSAEWIEKLSNELGISIRN